MGRGYRNEHFDGVDQSGMTNERDNAMGIAKTFYRRAALACSILILIIFGDGLAMANSEAKILSPDDIIMVPESAADSSDPHDILDQNMRVIGSLLGKHLLPDEVSRAGLTSHIVYYYLGEIQNGGFEQFAFNSQWDRWLLDIVRQGLAEMGAHRHLVLFEEAAKIVNSLSNEELAAYLQSGRTANSALADRFVAINDRLSKLDDRFFELDKAEDLVRLNAAWLKSHPALRTFSSEHLEQEIGRREAAISDRAQRIEAAKTRQR